MRAIDDTSSVVGEFDVFRESWWGGERNSRESWKETCTTTESWKYLNDREWNFWFWNRIGFGREIRTKYIFTKMCVYIYIFDELYVSELFGERRNICKKWRYNRDNAQRTEEDKRDEGKETKKCRVSGTRVLNCGWKYTSKCKRATRGPLPLWFTSVTDAHHGFACRHLDQVFP